MGDIVGGIIGGVGSLVGGAKAKSTDLTGFNYLAKSPLASTYLPAGAAAVGQEQGIQGQEAALLGANGTSPQAQQQAQTAFQNYLGSTGYNFQLQQGTQAITGSAAARGILNSGSTAKALEGYGQGLAGQYFNNYLGQLGGLNQQATGTAQQGLGAGQAIGQAGTQGGVAAGGQVQQGISTAGGIFGRTAADNPNLFNNMFGNV